MGGSCTKEVQEALNGAVKNHLTDMSQQVLGNEERQSGGIRLVDMHGGGAASIFIGAILGLLMGGAIATWITRKAMMPWKNLAVAHARLKGEPLLTINRAAASARLNQLNAAPPSSVGVARISEVRDDDDDIRRRRRGSSDDVRRLAQKINRLEVASERLQRRAIPLPPPSPSPSQVYLPVHAAAPSPAPSMASIAHIPPCQQTAPTPSPSGHFVPSPQP